MSYAKQMLDACRRTFNCAAVCKRCGDECERHAQMHQHCRVCAEACRRCGHACKELLNAVR